MRRNEGEAPSRRRRAWGWGRVLAGALVFAGFLGAADSLAASLAETTRNDCIQRAETNPDQTRGEARAWFARGGGENARLCEAFALAYAQENEQAAGAFLDLAQGQEKNKKKSLNRTAAHLYALAGENYHRAKRLDLAEKTYTLALKKETQNPDIWHARAKVRAAQEKFWEALDDLNKALTLMPNDGDFLRTRGQVWLQLGQDTQAKADFLNAAREASTPVEDK